MGNLCCYCMGEGRNPNCLDLLAPAKNIHQFTPSPPPPVPIWRGGSKYAVARGANKHTSSIVRGEHVFQIWYTHALSLPTLTFSSFISLSSVPISLLSLFFFSIFYNFLIPSSFICIWLLLPLPLLSL